MILIGKRNLSLIKRELNRHPFEIMNIYDKMPGAYFPPYAMLANPKNYRSAEINTDNFGFRKSLYEEDLIDVEQCYLYDKVNLLIGGSTVFGVGASNDEHTISSLLNKLTGQVWINFGVRGAVSFQEYIHMVTHITKFQSIDRVVFFSGINDLYRNLIDSNDASYDKRFGFQNELFSSQSARRIALKWVQSLFTGKSVDQLLQDTDDQVAYQFNIQDSLKAFKDIYSRNFQLYSALAKQFNVKIDFLLQPFLPVAKPVMASKENAAVSYTEQKQEGGNWSVVKKRIIQSIPEVSGFLAQQANVNNIDFFDMNQGVYHADLDLFVDSVHLTDQGHRVAAEAIYEIVG